MSDKRYRECMAEITAVLQKYDMAGAVTIVDKQRAMFKYTFPTWGCIQLESAGLRFRSRRADYPSSEAQREATEQSAHIILQMRDIAAQVFRTCETIGEQLSEYFDIEHKPFQDFDPETEQ